MESVFSAMEASINKVEGNNPASSTPLSATIQCNRPATSLFDGIAEAVRQNVATRMCKLGVQEVVSSNQNEDTDTEEEQDNIPTPSRIQKIKDTYNLAGHVMPTFPSSISSSGPTR